MEKLHRYLDEDSSYEIRRKYGQNHFNRYMFTAAHQQLRSVCICKTEFQA